MARCGVARYPVRGLWSGGIHNEEREVGKERPPSRNKGYGKRGERGGEREKDKEGRVAEGRRGGGRAIQIVLSL